MACLVLVMKIEHSVTVEVEGRQNAPGQSRVRLDLLDNYPPSDPEVVSLKDLVEVYRSMCSFQCKNTSFSSKPALKKTRPRNVLLSVTYRMDLYTRMSALKCKNTADSYIYIYI